MSVTRKKARFFKKIHKRERRKFLRRGEVQEGGNLPKNENEKKVIKLKKRER